MNINQKCKINLYFYLAGEFGQRNRRPLVALKENISGKFESRFSTVKIRPSPAIMLQGMENNVLGVWVAHAEGVLWKKITTCFRTQITLFVV